MMGKTPKKIRYELFASMTVRSRVPLQENRMSQKGKTKQANNVQGNLHF